MKKIELLIGDFEYSQIEEIFQNEKDFLGRFPPRRSLTILIWQRSGRVTQLAPKRIRQRFDLEWGSWRDAHAALDYTTAKTNITIVKAGPLSWRNRTLRLVKYDV